MLDRGIEHRGIGALALLHSWFEYNYLSVNEAKTKVLSLDDNPTHIQLFADRTKPPLDVVK